jgi:integrase
MLKEAVQWDKLLLPYAGVKRFQADNAATALDGQRARDVTRAPTPRAGLMDRDVVLRTLRHTATSRMIAAVFDRHAVMELSSHKSHQMLKLYSYAPAVRSGRRTPDPLGPNAGHYT